MLSFSLFRRSLVRSITFTPTQVQTYRLNVRIFDRCIEGSPLTIEITNNHRFGFR